ncbi:MAG: DUF4411 family protein [Myxococcales bacterium FL481]|nr:MAG: DUF4411 family protein [Myxococcales bacterium FL481]
MLYLVDASTLISAKNSYYPLDRVPEFWDWLVHNGSVGTLKIPIETYEEFQDKAPPSGKKDDLALWADLGHVREALLLDEEIIRDHVTRITYDGYVKNPTDEDLEKMGRDPLLISYALRDTTNRCIVTNEISKPRRKHANRHIPDVCADFGIRCINIFALIQKLNFSTRWQG